MKRLFQEHKLRRVTCLDGIWKFVTADSDAAVEVCAEYGGCAS